MVHVGKYDSRMDSMGYFNQYLIWSNYSDLARVPGPSFHVGFRKGNGTPYLCWERQCGEIL